MDIQIQVKGVDELVRNLRDLGVNRIPNYVARALTEIANQTQDAMIGNARSMLTIRGNWLVKGYKYGINRKQAYKNNLTAEVSTAAPWLIEQETKTTRTPFKRSNIAVPTKWIRPSRLNEEIIKASMRPRRLLRTFKLISKFGNEVIYQRVGYGKQATMLPMYVLKKSEPLPTRVHLIKTATKTINKVCNPVMESMIRQAVSEKGP